MLRRVTGKTIERACCSSYLWSKLGVEQDAYFTVDTTGVEFAGGGSEPHAARPGALRRDDAAARAATTASRSCRPRSSTTSARGGDREQFAGAGYTQLPGWSYRRMWWVSHNEHGAFAARGIHGQAIYVDPAAEMVVARFASHPQGANVHLDPTSLPAYHALAKHLLKKVIMTLPRAPGRHRRRRHAVIHKHQKPIPSRSATAAGSLLSVTLEDANATIAMTWPDDRRSRMGHGIAGRQRGRRLPTEPRHSSRSRRRVHPTASTFVPARPDRAGSTSVFCAV